MSELWGRMDEPLSGMPWLGYIIAEVWDWFCKAVVVIAIVGLIVILGIPFLNVALTCVGFWVVMGCIFMIVAFCCGVNKLFGL